MNVYILFKSINVYTINENKKYFSEIIQSIARKELFYKGNVDVLFCNNSNLNKDVQIIIDYIPQPGFLRKLSKRDMLEGFRKQVWEMLQVNMPELMGKECTVMADSNFVLNLGNNEWPKNDQDNSRKADGFDSDEFDYEKKADLYRASTPKYTFDRVILSEKIINRIEESLNLILCEKKVFLEWGLYTIQPNPSAALSFYGPSGTGKTMAAEAIADKINKKILRVSYADIESKYHGEGPKMVKAIFRAAERDDAVLFIDEADSLLSKRLTNVTQGSEQAINSMRSELLICLEQFKGIVIFATNLVVNYDSAFLTRLTSIEFVNPDEECRKKIWDVHISGNGIRIPLASDIDTEVLSRQYDFCGREIRKAVVSACVNVAMRGGNLVTQDDFLKAADRIVEEDNALKTTRDYTKASVKNSSTLDKEALDVFKDVVKEKIREHNEH